MARTLFVATGALAASILSIVPATGQTVIDPKLIVQVVTAGLALPTGLAFIGPGDILITQKNDGLVRRVLNGVLQPGAVLDVAVDSASERGLLGIAVDPDFPINHRVFLYYTESSTGGDTSGEAIPLGNRVYHYTWNGNQLVNPVRVLDLPVLIGPNHNGGVITFGPDGALYAVIGDLTGNGPLQNNPSGDPDDTGVILRVDPSGAGLADNPFANSENPADPMRRYFAYGVRNSFGVAFDLKTGSLWDTENGPNVYDEVNLVPPGFNSGWNRLMGPADRDSEGTSDLLMAAGAVYSDPEFSWRQPVAPTALAFPASPVMGCTLKDDLLVADNNCGQLYRFDLNASRDALEFTSAPLLDHVADNVTLPCTEEQDEIRFGSGFGIVTDLENGPDGWLYGVSLFPGNLFRIRPNAGTFPDADADSVADACDCAPSDAGSFASPSEVPHMRAAAVVPQALSWDSQAAAAGTGTTYTLVTGDLAALRSAGGYAAACTLREDLPQTEFTDTRPDPPLGRGYYYLVRAENNCGDGTFGNGTTLPDPRDALDASLPGAC